MRSRKRRFIAAAITALLFVAAYWVLAKELQPETGRWVKVERRDLVVGVPIDGELRAVESELITPPQIENTWQVKISWMAPEGSAVSVGQPVLRLDVTQLRQSLQEKSAERDSAQKSLEKKKTDLEIERRGLDLSLAEAEGRLRKARLLLDVPEQATARAELEKARIDQQLAELEIASIKSKIQHFQDRSQADLDAFRDRRDRAEARVLQLEQDIESMTVKAGRAGTLIYVSNWRGEKPKSGDSVWRAQKLMEIPDLARMKAEAEVAEADVGRVSIGQNVTLRLDAHPDQPYRGRVSSIRRTVQRKSRRDPKKIVKLEIELDSTDTERMRPGMRFSGQIEIERVRDTLVVPQEAVFPRPDGAVVYVRTLTGQNEVKPTFGTRNQQEFGITAGLEEGAWVLRRHDSLEEGS